MGRLPVVTAALVTLAHRHGVRVHVWTVDDETEMGRFSISVVDGLMSDRIDTLRHVFQQRGCWAP